jgi:hypothetical protein
MEGTENSMEYVEFMSKNFISALDYRPLQTLAMPCLFGVDTTNGWAYFKEGFSPVCIELDYRLVPMLCLVGMDTTNGLAVFREGFS